VQRVLTDVAKESYRTENNSEKAAHVSLTSPRISLNCFHICSNKWFELSIFC